MKAFSYVRRAGASRTALATRAAQPGAIGRPQSTIQCGAWVLHASQVSRRAALGAADRALDLRTLADTPGSSKGVAQAAPCLLPSAAVAAAIAVHAGVGALAAPFTPISSTVVLVPEDLAEGRCSSMVERAAAVNGRSQTLQFAPTMYWVDSGEMAAARRPGALPPHRPLGYTALLFAGPANPPPGFDPSCKGNDFLASYYCYNRFNATSVRYFCYDHGTCSAPPSGADIQRFADSLAVCLREATARGFDIAVNVHVDDATRGGLGGWRNTLVFDPLERYSGAR